MTNPDDLPPFVKLHRRQFVLWNQPVDLPDWKTKTLTSGQILSWDPDLEVHFDPDNHPAFLGHKTGGRGVSLDGDKAVVDCCALAGLYYGRGADGQGLMTSSPALAAALSAYPGQTRHFTWKDRVNWFVAPGSPVPGFKKLLRDQCLDTTTLKISHINRTVTPLENTSVAVQQMSDYLVAYFSALKGQRIVLALTAGLDSRTLLAAMLAAEVPFEALTLDVGPGSLKDIITARKICKFLGVKHHVGRKHVSGSGISEQSLLNRHTLNAVDDAINTLSIPQRLYRSLHADDILVRGGCFEIGREFYSQQLGGMATDTTTPDALMTAMAMRPATGQRDTVSAWLDWRRAHADGLALEDSFYLDQRLGGWLSMEELAHDVLPARSVQPANAQIVLSALCTATGPERHDGAIQKRAITYMAPRLDRFAINPMPWQTVVARARRKLTRYFRR